MNELSLPAVLLLMVPESACVPVPSEMTLMAAGFGVDRGLFSFPAAVLAATAGNVIGSLIAYAIGRSGWLERLPGRAAAIVARCGAIFDRYGDRAVFIARLLPLARTFVSLPAGHARVPLVRFAALTVAGCAIWSAAFVLVGTLTDAAWHSVSGTASHAFLAVGVLILAWFVAVGGRPASRPPARDEPADEFRSPSGSYGQGTRQGRTMSINSQLAIDATGLEKSFGDTKAVCGVDLAVRRGSVYGMLGPNGAGKTTTIRMLATLLRPDGGEARVLGHDVVREADEVRRSVSLTGQLASVDEDLTGRENLILIGRLLGYHRGEAKARADDLLQAFGLSDASGRLVKNYSGGMRRRLDIAASLVVTPELMFLDEPTTGLDPRSRNQVWDIIRALSGAGTTVLLCTQYLDEADQLADGIAVIDQGKVIAEGTPAQLKDSVGSGALRIRLLDPEQRPLAEPVVARSLACEVHFEADPAALSAPCGSADQAAEVVGDLSRQGIAVANFSLGQPSLDEVFLALTGHTAEDQAEESQVEDQDQTSRSSASPAERSRIS